MTGNANTQATRRLNWFRQLVHKPRPYFALDGGSGAHLFAALLKHAPSVVQVDTPRQASVLLIAEPVSPKLVPAVVETVHNLARPVHILLIGEPGAGLRNVAGIELAALEALLLGARRVWETMGQTVLDAVLHAEQFPVVSRLPREDTDAPLIQLPQHQEMATELVVLSLGPLQPFTAGPLRLFLICDGEQVLSTQVEAGYAHRGIAEAMTQAPWETACMLARHLDPLAPIAGQLAYVQALEHLQHWQSSAQLTRLRAAAAALERVQNHLWWLVRFAHLLGDLSMLDRVSPIASKLTHVLPSLWSQPPAAWILPQHRLAVPGVRKEGVSDLRQVADEVAALEKSIKRHRWLALRTQGIGALAVDRLKTAGVSGPVLRASEQGAGDVRSRLFARLNASVVDVQAAIEALVTAETEPTHEAHWIVPAGEAAATVEGPRGALGIHLVSSGDEKPAQVKWQRPSAALLPLLPEMLAGQKVADAEIIIASLDLAMAEVDG